MNVTRFLIACSSLLLGLGLIGPTLTIFPKAGDLTWFIKIIAPEELEVSTYSILGVIQKLFQTNDIFLAVILAIFSVFSPVLKLSFYWHASGLKDSKKFNSTLQIIHYVGKFSMAEVFALALIIVIIKSFPGGSTANLEWGAYLFTFSVICSMVVSFRLDSRKG
jgi:paraquat-inducible protein A